MQAEKHNPQTSLRDYGGYHPDRQGGGRLWNKNNLFIAGKLRWRSAGPTGCRKATGNSEAVVRIHSRRFMNEKQIKAASRLQKALEACHKAGLKGGVFDCSFCLWPINAEPNPLDAGWRFFEVVRECGDVLTTKMNIDGGAGV